jgi:hypothetical protein
MSSYFLDRPLTEPTNGVILLDKRWTTRLGGADNREGRRFE